METSKEDIRVTVRLSRLMVVKLQSTTQLSFHCHKPKLRLRDLAFRSPLKFADAEEGVSLSSERRN